MNSTEKLALIERVNHASEDQAKRALQSMILKCTVTQSTIARAIKDAIERHTPTPLIVYEEPETRGDGNAARASNNNENGQSHREQDDDVVLSAASEEHDNSDHDDIDAVKINAKKKSKRKGSGHHHSHYSSESSRKKKSKKIKHASKLRTEVEQTPPKVAIGRPSKQFKPSVIDLVSSSDAEIHDSEQPVQKILDKRVSDDNLDLVTSSEDEPAHPDGSKVQTPNKQISNDDLEIGNLEDRSSTTDSSDDRGSKNEQQNHALAGGVRASQKDSNLKTTQINTRNGDEGRRAQSVTFSMAKPSNQRDDSKMGSAGFDRKRKAPEFTVEEVHTDQPAKSTSDVHLVKRPKQNHLKDPKKKLDDWKCRKCGLIFPSVTQLLEHHLLHREDATATDGRHHHSNMPADDRLRQFEQHQKASTTASDGFTGKPENTVQLPSRPHQRAPADQDLSKPPSSFIQQPAGSPCVPPIMPSALARPDSGIQSSPSGQARRPLQKPFSNFFLDHHLRIPDRDSLRQNQYRETRPEIVHKCWACKQLFRESENAVRVCSCHPGNYQLLTERQMNPNHFKGRVAPSQPYFAWTCCLRPDEDAPPCRPDSRHSRHHRWT